MPAAEGEKRENTKHTQKRARIQAQGREWGLGDGTVFMRTHMFALSLAREEPRGFCWVCGPAYGGEGRKQQYNPSSLRHQFARLFEERPRTRDRVSFVSDVRASV